MTPKGLRLRSLTFHGPGKPPANIAFGPGLNVIYGASDTGKSFIVEALDFMLGGKGPLRDLQEREGYDRILLAIETLAEEKFTIQRSTQGGAFRVFDGLYSEVLPEGDGKDLAEAHNDKKDDNLSIFLLSKLDLAHKRIKKNKRGETNSLSFRNLARLVIVNEEEIIQRRTPLSDGSYTADTANAAIFKLLLTGVDDSALATPGALTPEKQSRGAQLDLLEQLIEDYRRQVKELAGQPGELDEQLSKLDTAIDRQATQLASTEAEYRDLARRRRDLIGRLDEANNRLTEIGALLERFALLQEHYRSDIDRLRAIEEAGSLFSALGESDCPLCGASPDHHRKSDTCDGDVDGIVNAARAEIAKIELRQSELTTTIASLTTEEASFRRRMPRIEADLSGVSEQVETFIAPNLRQLRRGYGELADKRGEVREALGIHRALKDFEDRKAALEAEDEGPDGAAVADQNLPTSTADRFAVLILDILKQWHFPHIQRVHFDEKTRDIVVNGKQRISYGKGLRAITYAAFVIGLLEYCRRNGTPHPGFAVLDSPLLSYREPEGQEDDLRGTDLNTCFYEFLGDVGDDRQVIIVENTDPPTSAQASPQAIKFTGNPAVGRAGYFPARDLTLEDLLG